MRFHRSSSHQMALPLAVLAMAFFLVGGASAAEKSRPSKPESPKSGAATSKSSNDAAKKPTPAPKPESKPEPTAKPVKLEPICITLEPAVLKTATSHPMPGAKATVLCPAREASDGLKLLTAEEFAAVGKDWNAFLAEAKIAAARHLATLTPELKKNDHGIVEYAILRSERHLTAGVILCPEFRALFKEALGTDLVVMAPDRFHVFVFPRRTGDFQQAGETVAEIYNESVYPASNEAFEINDDGIRAIGSFLTNPEATDSRN